MESLRRRKKSHDRIACTGFMRAALRAGIADAASPLVRSQPTANRSSCTTHSVTAAVVVELAQRAMSSDGQVLACDN